jgi:hypothetical protein
MAVGLAASEVRCGQKALDEENFFFLAAVFVRAFGSN